MRSPCGVRLSKTTARPPPRPSRLVDQTLCVPAPKTRARFASAFASLTSDASDASGANASGATRPSPPVLRGRSSRAPAPWAAPAPRCSSRRLRPRREVFSSKMRVDPWLGSFRRPAAWARPGDQQGQNAPALSWFLVSSKICKGSLSTRAFPGSVLWAQKKAPSEPAGPAARFAAASNA